MDAEVLALTVFDEGSGAGPALYAGGRFTSAGGVTVDPLARWDGASWSSLGSGISGSIAALTGFEDGSGSGPSLIAAGAFITSPSGDGIIARWGCPPCLADQSGDGMVNFLDVLLVLSSWGPCAGCPGDVDDDGVVGFADLLAVLSAWGPCS